MKLMTLSYEYMLVKEQQGMQVLKVIITLGLLHYPYGLNIKCNNMMFI